MADRAGATLASLVGIVLAGGIAAVVAWWIVAAIGLAGLAGALATVVVAMLLALALFALGAAIVKKVAEGRE